MAVTTVKRALRTALRSWFEAQLTSLTGLVVLDAWPPPGMQMPDPVISIEAPGEIHTEFHPATPFATAVTSGAQGTVSYSYGWLEVDIQLDCWARSQPERDTMSLALEGAIAVSPSVTLGVSSNPNIPSLRRSGGLVLPIPNLLGAPCEFQFESSTDITEDDNAAHFSSWRSTVQGTATLHMVTQEQCSLMQHLLVQFGDHTFHLP